MANGGTNRASLGIVIISLATVAMALAVAAGLWLIGPPSEQAAMRTDRQRVEDLRRIAASSELYWKRNGRLPGTLSDASRVGGRLSTQDPETGETYEFRPQSGSSFELCAAFARPSEDVLQDSDWTHQAGRQCFMRKADNEKPGQGAQ